MAILQPTVICSSESSSSMLLPASLQGSSELVFSIPDCRHYCFNRSHNNTKYRQHSTHKSTLTGRRDRVHGIRDPRQLPRGAPVVPADHSAAMAGLPRAPSTITPSFTAMRSDLSSAYQRSEALFYLDLQSPASRRSWSRHPAPTATLRKEIID